MQFLECHVRVCLQENLRVAESLALICNATQVSFGIRRCFDGWS